MNLYKDIIEMNHDPTPPKKNVGVKIRYDDPLHEYMRNKQREYYWKRKREKEQAINDGKT